MDSKHLPNKFFAANPLKEMSAALLTHFKISNDFDNIMDEMLADTGGKIISESRKQAMEMERLQIQQTDDPAILVDFARKIVEMANHRFLISKILQFEDGVFIQIFTPVSVHFANRGSAFPEAGPGGQ